MKRKTLGLFAHCNVNSTIYVVLKWKNASVVENVVDEYFGDSQFAAENKKKYALNFNNTSNSQIILVISDKENPHLFTNRNK